MIHINYQKDIIDWDAVDDNIFTINLDIIVSIIVLLDDQKGTKTALFEKLRQK